MARVKFDCSPQEARLVSRIVDRAVRKAAEDSVLPPGYFDRRDLSMDLIACHANGCPLDFARLLDAPDFDFAHDIHGIQRHIDRTTGGLKNHFVPRYALPEGADDSGPTIRAET